MVPIFQRWDSSAFSWRSTRQSACKSARGAKGLGFGLCPTDVSFVFTQTLPSQSFYPLFLIFRLALASAVRFHSPGLRTLVYTAARVHGLHSLSNLSYWFTPLQALSIRRAPEDTVSEQSLSWVCPVVTPMSGSEPDMSLQHLCDFWTRLHSGRAGDPGADKRWIPEGIGSKKPRELSCPHSWLDREKEFSSAYRDLYFYIVNET